MNLSTIIERKKYMQTVIKFIDKKAYDWNCLTLAVEGKNTNLRIWIGNEKSISDGCGKQLIYMRLDCYQQYSAPLNKETAKYLKANAVIEKLMTFYEFGQTDISRLDEVLEITKDLKYRALFSW